MIPPDYPVYDRNPRKPRDPFDETLDVQLTSKQTLVATWIVAVSIVFGCMIFTYATKVSEREFQEAQMELMKELIEELKKDE